tara:strand:+ start:1816 stop:2007 length:192 start_codon:yes stop_codon:yes gene_type:complete
MVHIVKYVRYTQHGSPLPRPIVKRDAVTLRIKPSLAEHGGKRFVGINLGSWDELIEIRRVLSF